MPLDIINTLRNIKCGIDFYQRSNQKPFASHQRVFKQQCKLIASTSACSQFYEPLSRTQFRSNLNRCFGNFRLGRKKKKKKIHKKRLNRQTPQQAFTQRQSTACHRELYVSCRPCVCTDGSLTKADPMIWVADDRPQRPTLYLGR